MAPNGIRSAGRKPAEGTFAAMEHLALSAIGRDRPGIVAAVTRVLLDHGVNVEDSQMTILRGHFTMTLILGVPDEADRAPSSRSWRPSAPGSASRRSRSRAWRASTASSRSRPTSSRSTARTTPASSARRPRRSPATATTSPTSTRGSWATRRATRSTPSCSRWRSLRATSEELLSAMTSRRAPGERRGHRARARGRRALTGRRAGSPGPPLSTPGPEADRAFAAARRRGRGPARR